MFCPNCGNQTEDGSRFCMFCGTRFEVQGAQQEMPQPGIQEDNEIYFVQEQPMPVPVSTQKKRPAFPMRWLTGIRLSKKQLAIGGGAVALAAVVLLLVLLIGAGGGEPNYALYIKDGEMFYHGLSGKPQQITEELLDGMELDDRSMLYKAYYMGAGVHVTEDGKTMFYMDGQNDGQGVLYRRSLTNSGKEPEKIASNVEQYAVLNNGKLVFYLKNATLHRVKGSNDEKIAKDVEDFRISDAGDVLYENEDGQWYLIYRNKEDKIGSDLEICFTTEKGVTYYQDEDRLYRKPFGKDKEKLVDDMDTVVQFEENSNFYFTRREELTLNDFFQADKEYENWMSGMEEQTYTPFYSLYYYNGKQEILLGEACANRQMHYISDAESIMESFTILYTRYDLESMGKLSYKDLEKLCSTEEYFYYSVYDVARIMIDEALAENASYCLCVDSEIYELDAERIEDFVYSREEKAVYLMTDVDEEKQEGTLLRADISGGKVGELAELDNDVYTGISLNFVGGTQTLYYYKDVEDKIGELYIGGERVDEDVPATAHIKYLAKEKAFLYRSDLDAEEDTYTIQCYDGKKVQQIAEDVYTYSIGNDGSVVFLYDYDRERAEGSLALYNGKVVQIGEDVHDYALTAEGDVLFLHDYSTKRYKGDLAVFNGRKVKKLDEDVLAIVTPHNGRYHYCV